jgi:hypothetical protein
MKQNKQTSSGSGAIRKYIKSLAILGLGAGVVFVVWGYINYGNSQQFSKHSASASGKVTKLTQQDTVKKPLEYFITYSFAAPGGSTYTGIDSVSPFLWQVKPVGSSVSVVYNSQNPAANYISGYQPTTSKAKNLILGGAGLFVLSLVILLFVVVL